MGEDADHIAGDNDDGVNHDEDDHGFPGRIYPYLPVLPFGAGVSAELWSRAMRIEQLKLNGRRVIGESPPIIGPI